MPRSRDNKKAPAATATKIAAQPGQVLGVSVRDIDTTAAFGGDVHFDDSKDFDGEGTVTAHYRRWGGPTPGDGEPQPIKSNLTRYRWHDPILSPSDERDLLRRAQGGDERAKNKLAESFHRTVVKIANEYYGPPPDDLMAAGMEGLAEAIIKFDLRRNTGLRAFAEHRIRWPIRQLVKQWRKRGNSSETRADRFVYDNPDAEAEDVVRAVEVSGASCSLRDAEAAIVRRDSYWNGHDYYSTTGETGYCDDTDHGRRIENDDLTRRTDDTAYSELRGMYQQFDPYSRSPQLRLHKHDGAVGRLLDFDRLQEQSNRRVIERIKQIGRSAAANEAVGRQNAMIADSKIDRGQHLYRAGSPLMDRLSNSRLWTAEFNGDAACISASESREWQKLSQGEAGQHNRRGGAVWERLRERNSELKTSEGKQRQTNGRQDRTKESRIPSAGIVIKRSTDRRKQGLDHRQLHLPQSTGPRLEGARIIA